MKSERPTFDDMIAAAKREDWAFVEQHIKSATKPPHVTWAMNVGLGDDETDNNVRDLAATVMEHSERPFLPAFEEQALRLIRTDRHAPVRLHLAAAFLRRGKKPEVVVEAIEKLVNDADPDVATFAKEYKQQYLS